MREISPQEAQELEAALCRSNIADFSQRAFSIVNPSTPYLHNWHIDCIAEHLHGCWDRSIKRLIINMPPRSLKSIVTSIAFPAWCLGKNPATQLIVGSYVEDLAIKHSVDTRLLIESGWYKSLFPNTVIARDQNEKRKFQTTRRGHRIATSVGSNITGEGADIIIVDDPLNPQDAPSDTMRDKANAWFDQTLVPRLNDKANGVIIVVMQRLHENDLTGHLMERGGWTQLRLPAIAEKKTIIEIGGYRWEREEGDFLHGEREGREVLEDVRRQLGAYAFAGQYQQRPAPLGGGDFKAEWIQRYSQTDNKGNTIVFGEMNPYILVDAATAKTKKSDYTAMIVVGLAPDNNYYVLDILRQKLNPTERIQELIKLHRKWNKLCGKPPVVGYEKYGMMSDTHYLKLAQDKINYRFPVVELGGKLAKEDRIRRLVPLMQERRIYLPHNLPYNDGDKQGCYVRDFIAELLAFPAGMHDDMIDALARIVEPDLCASFPLIKEAVHLNVHNVFMPDERQDDFMSW